jgi:hypothetical protein
VSGKRKIEAETQNFEIKNPQSEIISLLPAVSCNLPADF